ncbi:MULTISPECIES: helix-turn-helix transcriptional regulator [Enterococcus]|uniref:helix-turn-helix transcriptional regulator n=1 Tax=Enterococcus TaxID=1350 RepID=UPI000EC68489|nr:MULTISPECIES: YafY family protein [Enterococcus]HCM85380.1 YafY family transcriptional regulator [Enterococcus sp.]
MQVERLLKMIFLLIRREKITTQELADYFAVSKRTILRDIETLSMANIPIFTLKGRKGGVGIMEQYTINKTVFSQEEQEKILHGLQLLKATQIPNTEMLLDKVDVLFSSNERFDWLEIDFSSFGSQEKEKEKFSQLQYAIINKNVATFDYFTSELKQNKRTVEPVRLIFKNNAWYVQAYCQYKLNFRLFRASRIKNLTLLDEKFVRAAPKGTTIKTNYEDHYQMIPFVLKFSPEISYRLFDEYDESCMTVDQEGYFHVTYEYADNDWLVRHLLSFGKHVEIIEPEYMKVRMRKEIEKVLENY